VQHVPQKEFFAPWQLHVPPLILTVQGHQL